MHSLPVPFFGLHYFYAGSEDCRPGHRWKGLRDHWLFHLVCGGRGRVVLGREVRYLEKGQGFLVAPDTEVDYEADRRDPWSYSWIACSGPEAAAGFRAAGLGPASPWYRAEDQGFSDPGGEFQRLTARLGDETDPFLQTAGLVAVFGGLRRALGALPPPPAGGTREVYAALVDDFLRRNLSRQDARIEAWARQVGISRKHLSEAVRSRRGASPRALLTEYRLTRAGELLASTGLSVAAVAASVGYGDPLAFSRAFRERYGISPRAWRAGSARDPQPRSESI